MLRLDRIDGCQRLTAPRRDVNFARSTASQPYRASRRPEGDEPRPAVVLMHGCSGLLDSKGRILGLYRAWARALVVQGYVTLDGRQRQSRGFGQTCWAGRTRITMWRDRPKDAYAALNICRPSRSCKAIGSALMGWSQGGGVALLTINDNSIGRPAGSGARFRGRGVVLSGRLRRPVSVETIHRGRAARLDHPGAAAGADRRGRVWTPFKPCDGFIAAAKARGNPVELKSYPRPCMPSTRRTCRVPNAGLYAWRWRLFP